MIWNIENSKGFKLIDNTGVAIESAFEFDDETCEVKFYVMGRRPDGRNHVVRSGVSFYGEGYKVVTASAIVKGARMVPRETEVALCSP